MTCLTAFDSAPPPQRQGHAQQSCADRPAQDIPEEGKHLAKPHEGGQPVSELGTKDQEHHREHNKEGQAYGEQQC